MVWGFCVSKVWKCGGIRLLRNLFWVCVQLVSQYIKLVTFVDIQFLYAIDILFGKWENIKNVKEENLILFKTRMAWTTINISYM